MKHQLTEPRTISEGAMKLVQKVSHQLGSTDRNEILMGVCENLENRWPSKDMERRLAQMGLQTTEKILYVIDVYLACKARGFSN